MALSRPPGRDTTRHGRKGSQRSAPARARPPGTQDARGRRGDRPRHHLQRAARRRARRIHACETPAPAPAPDAVEAQLQALRRGRAGLQSRHALMSPAYHERLDAFARFSARFDSPLYEPCSDAASGASWVLSRRGAAGDAAARRPTFLGTAAVEQLVRVEVSASRAKWADTGFVGVRGPTPAHEHVRVDAQPPGERPLARRWDARGAAARTGRAADERGWAEPAAPAAPAPGEGVRRAGAAAPAAPREGRGRSPRWRRSCSSPSWTRRSGGWASKRESSGPRWTRRTLATSGTNDVGECID